MKNRIANTKNEFQGKFKKVLCVCSAGMLRSPTAAWVLSNKPFNFNTRSCGISKEFALIVFDEVLAEWADEFVVFNQEQFDVVSKLSKGKVIVNLDIEDIFDFKDEELINLITTQYNE